MKLNLASSIKLPLSSVTVAFKSATRVLIVLTSPSKTTTLIVEGIVPFSPLTISASSENTLFPLKDKVPLL